MPLKVEKTQSDNGVENFVIVDENYNIIEEVVLFLNWLEKKGMSTGTLETYCNDLKEFFSWLEFREMKFYEVRKRDMLSWLDYLENNVGKRKPKSARTKNRYLATIASFYRYYEGLGGWIESNPLTIKDIIKHNHYLNHPVSRKSLDFSFFRVKEPKSKNTRRLARSQIQALYEGIEQVQSEADLIFRNKLMFRILYETGCRIGECLGLRLNDYEYPKAGKNYGLLWFRTHSPLYHKDHKLKTLERQIPVSADLIYSIDEYVCNIRPDSGQFQTILVNHRRPNEGNYMTRGPVNTFFNDLSRLVDIECTPHWLRHTHGTELKEAGFDNVYIQHRLGHSSINSTAKYMHPDLETQGIAYEKFQKQRRSALLQ
ncbi:tyrosine-type recombinase/integrase [Paenibacillus campinasensis]|uniref:Tyrosine-type recombinase/integrase n=1 Tax=Paenibacillus campinasensis TaxID=66347 RepID=A0ABW9T8A2_9BACL|nr:tyrosine-type recombinase/integrase [Paenibacillus campinasensis]MUG68621.1 tyrosine-type recombinase/integrase [Paenibacillus campinasensis]